MLKLTISLQALAWCSIAMANCNYPAGELQTTCQQVVQNQTAARNSLAETYNKAANAVKLNQFSVPGPLATSPPITSATAQTPSNQLPAMQTNTTSQTNIFK